MLNIVSKDVHRKPAAHVVCVLSGLLRQLVEKSSTAQDGEREEQQGDDFCARWVG